MPIKLPHGRYVNVRCSYGRAERVSSSLQHEYNVKKNQLESNQIYRLYNSMQA